MTSPRRRRHPRVPDFKPLDELAPGDPFNPYELFEGYSVRQAIGRFPKLRPAGKFIYLMLADQVYGAGYDWHTQRNLAELVGLSVDQFQYHLDRLKKLHLVHVAHDIGRQNYLWLLYHPVFALCSPLTHRKSPVGVTGELRQGLPENSGTQRNVQRNVQRIGGVNRFKATSYRGEPAPEGEEMANLTVTGNPSPEEPITDSSFTLAVKNSARQFFYSLTPHEKRRRYDQAGKLLADAEHFRGYLKDPDRAIQRQARHEIDRRLTELGALGFLLVTPNGRERT